MAKTRLILAVLSFLCFLTYAGAILCYSCGTSSEGDGCLVNSKGLKRDRLGFEEDRILSSRSLRNCSKNQPYCMTEKVETRGDLVSYIRGCAEGTSSFSFDLRQFQGMAADNQTNCVSTQGNLVCVALCAEDFCNGPSGASQLSPCTPLLLIFVLFLSKVLYH